MGPRLARRVLAAPVAVATLAAVLASLPAPSAAAGPAAVARTVSAGAAPLPDVARTEPTRATRLTQTGAGLNNVVACPANGACVVGGTTPVKKWYQADIVAQSGAAWTRTRVLPGITRLSPHGASGVTGLSCATVGECVAVGYYDRGARGANGSALLLVFVAVERGGVWGQAHELSGLASLAPRRYASVGAVSCGGVGECVVVGSVRGAGGAARAFLADDAGGVIGPAELAPGLAALGARDSVLTSVSCPQPGECTAAGQYESASGRTRAFSLEERGGTWGAAAELPGIAALSGGGGATVTAVSCWSPGDCALGGDADQTAHSSLAFVASELAGSWQPALDVPGVSARTDAHLEQVLAVACTGSGSCVAGGYYRASDGPVVPFVVTADVGTWHQASSVLGPAIRVGGSGAVTSMSCASSGRCAAGGTFRVRGGGWRTFLVDQVGGAWGDALALPAPPTPSDADNAWVGSVSCLASMRCAAAGYFQPARRQFVATATSFSPPGPGILWLSPRTGPTRAGRTVLIHGTNLRQVGDVRFGARSARSFDVVNLETIRAVAPAGHGDALVVLTGQFGASGAPAGARYAFQSSPTVASISPDSGAVSGGTVVVVHGRDLVGTTSVMFGTHRARVVVVLNAGAVRVVAPAGTGSVRVAVTTPEGRSRANGVRFSYGRAHH